MRFAITCLLTLLLVLPVWAQLDAEASTIVLEQIEVTGQPAEGLEIILNLDLSNASPQRKVELSLLGADYALQQRRFGAFDSFLKTASSNWDALQPEQQAMARFLYLTLQQKAEGLRAPGAARQSLTRDLEIAMGALDSYQVLEQKKPTWVCSHLFIGRAFGYWIRELLDHQLLIEQDVTPHIERVKQKAESVAVGFATEAAIPTLGVSHGYLRELLEAQETLEPEDPLYPLLSLDSHLAQVRTIARERGAGPLVEESLKRLQAYRNLYQLRRLTDKTWGRTFSQAEAMQVREALMGALPIVQVQADLRLTAELFVTSFEASLASSKPGWMDAVRQKFLEPPNFLKNFPRISARYMVARARFYLLDGQHEKAVQDAQLAVDIYQAWFQEAGFSDEGLAGLRRDAARAYEVLIEARLRTDDTSGAFAAAADYQILEGLSVLAVQGEKNIFKQTTADSVAKSLGPKEALVLFFPGRSKLYSFLLTDHDLKADEFSIKSPALQSQVQSYLKQIRRQVDVDESSRELYRTLLGRFNLSSLKTLHIAPSSFLANLPWSSLRNPNSEPLLTSHSCAVQLAFSQPEPHRDRPRYLRAIANPDGSLPGAEREVQEIARLIKPSDIALGEKASRGFVDAFPGGVMHFATHGSVNYRKPQSSHLLLGGNDHLTAGEIVKESWSQADVVVLSACNTGASPLDVIGHRSLAGAFLKAGAPIVLGTLWPVDDEATRLFMEEFYSQLASGNSPSKSMKQAQQKLRDNPDYEHPYYWAAFVLFGV